MKKIFLATFAICALAAQAALPEANIPQRIADNAKKQTALKINEKSASVLRNHLAASRAEVMQIVDSVKGDRSPLTIRGNAYFSYNGDEFVATFQDRASNMVEVGDEVYIYNPVSMLPTSTYMKGKKDADGNIVISFPQMIFEAEENGEIYTYYLDRMKLAYADDGTSWMYIDTENRTYTFENGGDGEWYMEWPEEESVLGITDEVGNWTGFGDKDVVFAIFEERPVTHRDGTPWSKWALTSNGDGRWVNIDQPMENLKDGDSFNIQGLFRSLPYAWTKATFSNNQLHIAEAQYLGVFNGYHAYFMPVKMEDMKDMNGNIVSTEVFVPELTFSYNPERLLFETDGICILNSGREYVGVFEKINTMRLNSQKELTSRVPQAPVVEYVALPQDDYDYMSLRFDLPVLSTNDEILDKDKMTYCIWFDDEVYALRPGPYSDRETITYIPYDYTDNFDVWVADIRHMVYFYDYNFTRIGVQSIYTEDDNQEYRSEITYRDKPSGVAAIADDSKIVSEQWYDLCGMRVEKPSKGIYLHKVVRENGNVTTTKEMVK